MGNWAKKSPEGCLRSARRDSTAPPARLTGSRGPCSCQAAELCPCLSLSSTCSQLLHSPFSGSFWVFLEQCSAQSHQQCRDTTTVIRVVVINSLPVGLPRWTCLPMDFTGLHCPTAPSPGAQDVCPAPGRAGAGSNAFLSVSPLAGSKASYLPLDSGLLWRKQGLSPSD